MRRRSTAEWVTFGAATAVVALVIGLILAQIPGNDDPAAPTARTAGPAERRADVFVVPVEVTNQGDAAAENVQVAAELQLGEETFEADQVVDFLAAGETEELQFVFEDDPEDGELMVRVTGFSRP